MALRLLLAALSLLAAGPAHGFVAPASRDAAGPSLQTATMYMASSPQHQPSLGSMATPVPPPPLLSMPVWSLACPVPFPITESGGLASSMSILTFVTPVSVSSPIKLWAISLYKTSLTRCAFLRIPRSGEEYNDIASIASSVNTAPGFTNNVRRRGSMGEAGILASSDEAVGWRAKRRAGESLTGSTGGGVGILQLMAPDQATLVSALGKKTGWDAAKGVNKREESASLGYEWVSVAGATGMPFDVLPNCASYLGVKLKRVVDGGDHDVAICEVTGTGVWDGGKKTVHWLSEDDASEISALDQSSALYTGQLRDEGIL